MRNLTIVLVLFSFLAGTLLTIFGLVHLEWPQALPWSDKGALIRFISFLSICTILVFVGSWWSRKSPLLVGVVVGVGFALLAGALWPLLVTLWFAIASAILGRTILGVLHLKAEVGNGLTCFLVGAGVYGTAVGLIAHFPVSYPGVYGAALALPVMLGWRVVVEESRSFLARFSKNNLAEFGVNKVDVAIVVVALVYFVVALMPEVGYDSLATHLFVPAHLVQRHQWGFDVSTYVWAVMPMLGDWIFSIGYMLAGEAAARLINIGFIFILGWLVRELVLWTGGSAVGVRWSVLIFLSTPLTFAEGSTLFIESIWASFVVAGTLAILSSCSMSGKPRFELPIAGLLLGYALAAKAVTFTILPVLLLVLVWRYRYWFKVTGLPLLLLGLCLFVVIGIIPYVTAWSLSGNPFFPLFNKIFQSPYYDTTVNFDNSLFKSGFTWDVFYRATFESEKYLETKNGVAGFQWLLLLLPLSIAIFAERRLRSIALLFVGVISIAITFHSTSYLRYVFPAWAILVAAIGGALDNVLLREVISKRFWFMAVGATIGLNLLFFSSGAFYKDFEIYSLIDQTSYDRYLLARQPIRRAVQFVNSLNDAQTPVAVFSAPLAAGLSGDYLYPGWYNISFVKEIRSSQSEQDLANIFTRRGVNFVILDSNWNGINCCSDEGKAKQALVEKVTEKIAEFGVLSVRKVNADYRFKTELLSNPDFKSITGWALAPEAKYDADTGVILTNVASSATQVVAVSSGQRYLNTVIARCSKEPTLGRIQINWLDVKGEFVTVDIKTFECTTAWSEQTMEVTAPLNVVSAIVYTTGHTLIPLEFKSNSLRQ